MLIRPATSRDVIPLITLGSYFFPTPPTDDDIRSLIVRTQVRVAESDSGYVVGSSVISRRNTMPIDHAFVQISVRDTHRRDGIGSHLIRDTFEQARKSNYSNLISRIADDDTIALAFADHHQFQQTRHMTTLILDLDTELFTNRTPQLPDGLTLICYADINDNDMNRRRLYTLNKTLSATIPIAEREDFPPFVAYVERKLSGGTFPHEGIFIVIDGDDWVGMSQISLHHDFAFIEMTGTLPAYRGQGIATALKRTTLQFASSQGRHIVKTVNDVGNSAMLAINQKAGFQRDGGFFFVKRHLS